MKTSRLPTPFLSLLLVAVVGNVAAGDYLFAPIRGAGWFDDVARNATRNADSNKLVLGHFPREGTSYQKVAAHCKATYFKVEPDLFLHKTTASDQRGICRTQRRR